MSVATLVASPPWHQEPVEVEHSGFGVLGGGFNSLRI